MGRQVILPRAQTAEKSATPCCGQPDTAAPREVNFPYYSLREGFQSTLLLVSDSPKPTDLTVAVRNTSGQAVFTSMSIQPQEKLAVDMRGLLTKLSADPDGAFAEGSVSVYFQGTIMPVVGQMTMTNPATRLIHESEMVESDPGRSDIPSVLNGLWWGIAAGRDAKIMVTNTAGEASTADVFLDFLGERHESAPVVFAPHETKVLSIAQLLAELKLSPAQAPEGGITIIPRGLHPSLIAQGKILDAATGFSTTLRFPAPELQHASALHASGVPIGKPSKDSPFAKLGTFTPHVIVRNLVSAAQTVTLTLEYPSKEKEGETEQTILAPLSVPGYGVEDFSLDSVLGQLPLPLPYCSIRLEYSGAPGTAVAEISSVDQSEDLVVDAKLQNEGNGWAGSGANPWHLDEETESIVFLTDMGDKPARIGFKVSAGGVDYSLADLKLSPHETRGINLRKLRDAQQADFKGNKVPAGATDGSVLWIRLDNVPVMGRVAVIKRQGGVASNYDCCICQCPAAYNSTYVTAATPYTTVGGTDQMAAWEWFTDCNWNAYSYNGVNNLYWASNAQYVATVSNSPVRGKATGVGGGSALISGANPSYFECYAYIPYAGCYCNEPVSPGGSGPVGVYSFTVNISPSTVAPLNAGTPNATTVTVQTNPFAISGKTVTVQDVRVANTGGHLNHPLPNSNVSGTFSPSSGTTDSQGRFQSTYTVKEFSGEYQIKATIEGRTVTGPITLGVQIQGLGELSSGANYTHVGQIAGIHEQNWFGTSSTRNGLVATANAFANQYPGSPVPYNDISLPWGGKFDSNAGDWTTLHAEHRVGRNADVNVCGWSQDQKDTLRLTFRDPNVGGATKDPLDECSSRNCWHVTW